MLYKDDDKNWRKDLEVSGIIRNFVAKYINLK